MNKYEAMIIIKANLKEEEKEAIFKQLQDIIVKNAGQIINQQVWLAKGQLTFSIKKQKEALYYLLQFNIIPSVISKLRQAFKLNESILRFMITKLD